VVLDVYWWLLTNIDDDWWCLLVMIDFFDDDYCCLNTSVRVFIDDDWCLLMILYGYWWLSMLIVGFSRLDMVLWLLIWLIVRFTTLVCDLPCSVAKVEAQSMMPWRTNSFLKFLKGLKSNFCLSVMYLYFWKANCACALTASNPSPGLLFNGNRKALYLAVIIHIGLRVVQHSLPPLPGALHVYVLIQVILRQCCAKLMNICRWCSNSAGIRSKGILPWVKAYFVVAES
jgi:hypothetical protein